MIKIIIPIISLDSILMIKHSGSGTPNDDQKHKNALIEAKQQPVRDNLCKKWYTFQVSKTTTPLPYFRTTSQLEKSKAG